MEEEENLDLGITLRAGRKEALEAAAIAKKKGMTMKSYVTQALASANKRFKHSMLYLLEVIEKNHPAIKIHHETIKRELANAGLNLIAPAVALLENNKFSTFSIIENFEDLEDKLKNESEIFGAYAILKININSKDDRILSDKVFNYITTPRPSIHFEIMPAGENEKDKIILFISYKKEDKNDVNQ